MQERSVLMVLGEGTSASAVRPLRAAYAVAAVAFSTFREQRAAVTVTTLEGTPPGQLARENVLLRGERASDPREALRRPLPLGGIDASEFDALALSDGTGDCTDLAASAHFAGLVRLFDRTQRPIVAFGRGIEALLGVALGDGTPFLRGRRVTCPSDDATLQARLRAAGAELLIESDSDDHVTVDAYLVTAQGAHSGATAARITTAFFRTAPRRRASFAI